MKISCWLHDVNVGLGHIRDWGMDRGIELQTTHWHLGELPPLDGSTSAVIILGGAMSVYEHDLYPWLTQEIQTLQHILSTQTPVLGICLGAQLLAQALGSQVYRNHQAEIGWLEIQVEPSANPPPFSWLQQNFTSMQWHQDTFNLPKSARLLARSEACAHQVFMAGSRCLGVQFHPEIDLEMAKNWVEQDPEELTGVGSVQTAQEIMSHPQRFQASKNLLYQILDEFLLQ